ncbi:MAG: alpha/beta fold hydrolase [Acetobacteraceae bacterium]|nr:alpha/beta fold hydrolase [Acetobacteraceae bacterium]
MPALDASLIRLHRIGTAPPLVLLHALGATRAMWDGLAGLAARFELISYDLPCHGETPAPASHFEIEDLADQLAAVLTGIGIARAHIAGSSLGGMVAQCFAAAYPSRVDRLVLCDTSPGLSEGMTEELLTMPGSGLAQAAMARADLMDLAEEIYAPALILCADGADLAMREGADFLARSIPRGELAFVAGTRSNVVIERPEWVARVVRDFLGR